VIPSENPADQSITMWGPPATGKTTFLAALSIALIRHGNQWAVKGVDKESTEKLIELTMTLIKDRSFPPATQGIAHYKWALHGQVKRKFKRRWFGWQLRDHPVRLRLDLVDSAGLLTSPNKDHRSAQDGLINNLMNSSAIIFLYDPIREVDDGDAFGHTFGVLQQMAQRAPDSPGERLPHYVAVCVTKFDEIRVLATAGKLGLLSYEELGGPPQVAEEDARDLFAGLLKVQPDGDADLVLNLLEQNFHRDRIKYFITSAIGFYVDRNGRFDHDDFQNHLQDPNEPRRTRIRGPIHPINVVEPLVWLTEKLTGAEDVTPL